jgi:hypothetical protein
MASSSARNHRMPVSPACCDNSHSRIQSASLSACADVSTRNAMLQAHVGKEVSGGPGTSGFYVFMTPANTFNSFLEILALPFQIGCQSFIECDGRVLAMSLRILFQLCLALRLEGYHIHGSSLRGEKARVKHGFVVDPGLYTHRCSISNRAFFRSIPQR